MSSLRPSSSADVAGVLATAPEARPSPLTLRYKRQRFPSSSPPPSSSAPLSTVPETKIAHQGEGRASFVPYGKKYARANIDACYPPSVGNDAERYGGECNRAESKEREIESTAVSVATEPSVFFRRNVDVAIQVGSPVRWVTSPINIRRQAHADGLNEATGGVGSQQDIRVGSSPGRSADDHELMVTVISEEADLPPVTRRIPRGGGCIKNLFNQPGCYTYYVSSGPVVTGRIFAKASGLQCHSMKPSATAKIMEAKHQQKTQIGGSPTCTHEREGSVEPSVVPQAALVESKKNVSSLSQSEVASHRISMFNETTTVGGSEICANGADEVAHGPDGADEQNSPSETVAASRSFSAQVESAHFPSIVDGSFFELIPASEEREVAAGTKVQTCVEDIEEIVASPERGYRDCVPLVATLASPAGSVQPNAAGSQSLEACVVPKDLGENNFRCIDDKEAVVGTPKREYAGDACTVARRKPGTGYRESDMAVSNLVGEGNAPDAISVGKRLASENSLSSVARPKGHGQNGVSTVSEVASEAEPTQSDATCFTLLDPAGPSHSYTSGSVSLGMDNLSQLAAAFADDGAGVPADANAEFIGETNEADILPLQRIKGGEVSVTSMLPRRASFIETFISGTPGAILSSVGTDVVESITKCTNYASELARSLGSGSESDGSSAACSSPSNKARSTDGSPVLSSEEDTSLAPAVRVSCRGEVTESRGHVEGFISPKVDTNPLTKGSSLSHLVDLPSAADGSAREPVSGKEEVKVTKASPACSSHSSSMVSSKSKKMNMPQVNTASSHILVDDASPEEIPVEKKWATGEKDVHMGEMGEAAEPLISVDERDSPVVAATPWACSAQPNAMRLLFPEEDAPHEAILEVERRNIVAEAGVHVDKTGAVGASAEQGYEGDAPTVPCAAPSQAGPARSSPEEDCSSFEPVSAVEERDSSGKAEVCLKSTDTPATTMIASAVGLSQPEITRLLHPEGNCALEVISVGEERGDCLTRADGIAGSAESGHEGNPPATATKASLVISSEANKAVSRLVKNGAAPKIIFTAGGSDTARRSNDSPRLEGNTPMAVETASPAALGQLSMAGPPPLQVSNVSETASASEERDAGRVGDVDVAGTDEIIGILRGKHEGATLLMTETASMPSSSLSYVPTLPCFEDRSTLEPISVAGGRDWPKEDKVWLDDTDKVNNLLERDHNGDGPSAVAMASPILMMLPENTPQSKPPNSTQLEHGSAPESVSAMRWSDGTEGAPVFVDREDGVAESATQGCGTDALQTTLATLTAGLSQSHAAGVPLLVARSRSSSVSTVLEKAEGTDVCVSDINHIASSLEQKRENDATPFASKALTVGSPQADTKDVPPTSSGSEFEGVSMVEERIFGETKVYAGETGELNGSSKRRYRGALRQKDVSPSASSMAPPAGLPLDASSARASTSSEEDDGGAWESGVYLRRTCDIAASPGGSHGGDVLSSSVTTSSAVSSHFKATSLPPADDGGETDRLTSTDGQKVLADMEITKVDEIDAAKMSKSRGIKDDTPRRRYGDETAVGPGRGVVESLQKSLVAMGVGRNTLSSLKEETAKDWNSAINSDGDAQHQMRGTKDCCGERRGGEVLCRSSEGDVENSAAPPQNSLLTSAISRREADHTLLMPDKVRVESQAHGDSEDKALIKPDAGDVVRSADDFVLPRLSEPVVPPEDREPFFAQARSGDGGGGGGGEPSSVDSDDVADESWIKGSGGHADTMTDAKQCLTTSCAVPNSVTAAVRDKDGEMPLVRMDMVAGVCLRPSPYPHEEAGKNPFASSLNRRGHIGGQGKLSSGTMTAAQSVGKEDSRMDNTLNVVAVVDDADAEKNATLSSVKDLDIVAAKYESVGKKLNAVGHRDTSEIEGADVESKSGDGRAGGSANIMRFLTSKAEPRCTYKGNSKGDIGRTGTGSLSGAVVSDRRCNGVKLSSGSPASASNPGGKSHPDEKLHATGDLPCNRAEPVAIVVASTQPLKEEKDKRQPKQTFDTKKGYLKKRVGGGSVVDIGGGTIPVVRTPDARGCATKHGASVMLGEQGTYLRKFGDHGVTKEQTKTLVASDRGFKPAKHLVVEVESIIFIKTASVCPHGCNEQRSVYVVGPLVPKDRRAHDGSKKKDLPRTSMHLITAGAPLEVVFIKPGDYWLVENSTSKRIRVTATPREPKLEPECEQHKTACSQDHPNYPTETGSEAIEAASSSSKNAKEGMQKSSDVTLDAEGVSTGKTAPGRGATLSSPTCAHYENGAKDLANGRKQSGQATVSASRDVPREQAREDMTFFLPSRQLPPVRAKENGERVSSDEYDGYGMSRALGVARVSHPKGFEPLKLELGFAPGLGSLVVCELDARQRVTREVVCRHIAPEEMDNKPAARGSKVKNEGATVVSTFGDATRVIDSNKQIEADGANMASARLGPGSLSICSFVLGRFGVYRLSFHHEVGASLTVLVCPPRDLPSPVPSLDPSSRKCLVSSSGVNEAYDGSQLRSQKGRYVQPSDEHIRDVIEKQSSQRTYRGGRDSDSPARVCNLNDASKSSALNPSADAGVHVRIPSVKSSMMESTQELRASGVTNSPRVRVEAAGDVSLSKDVAINDRCSCMQQRRSQAQHRAKLQTVKNERSKTTKTAALAAEIAPEETAKGAADVQADTTQVASRVARVTPPSPAMVRLDDGVTSSGSAPWASSSRKEDIRSGAWQSTSMSDLVAAVAEVSAAPKSETSTTAGPTGIANSNATAPSARGRRNAQRRTRDVVYESKNRKAASQKEAQLEARRKRRFKSEAGEQTDEADHNTIVSDRNLREGTAVGSSTTTPAAVILTGWPEPIEGASWTQADVEPEVSASFSLRNEREGRPGVNTDANAERVYFSGICKRVGSSNAEKLSYSARDVRGKPRSRKPRSSLVQGLPQRPNTSPGAKASQSRPIPPPLSDQVLVRKVPLDMSACSGWGSVSPSATHGNDNGWPPVIDEVCHDSAASTPKSGEPPASPRGGAELVFSGATKTAELNHPYNRRREESCPCQDSITKIAKSRTDSLKGLASTADHTSSRQKIETNKGFVERSSVLTAKAAAESASACNASLPSMSVPECIPMPRSSNPIAEGAFFIVSPGQVRAASISPCDLQISFGNYVSDTEAATQVAAGTPSVSSSDNQVAFPAAPVGGECGVNTDPLALLKGTSGWTSPADDRDPASTGLGEAVGKSVRNGDSSAEKFQKPNGAMRSVSEGGWGEETTVSALAGATAFASDEQSVWSRCYPQTVAEETLVESRGAVTCDSATPVPAAAAPEAQGLTSTRTEVLTDQSDNQRKPRWGNCSTKISLAERQRRSEQLKDVCLPPEVKGSALFEVRLAAFPEASRQPSGGYWMPEDAEDTLPPPSAYEIEETVLMMKKYNDIMERLRTTGYDEELPNGYRPKIYDLTGGPRR